jgi:hypothetical protein
MLKKIIYVFCSLAILVSFSFAQKATYVGSKKCKPCHTKDGSYAVWEKSKHATAYTTLTTAESTKLAGGKDATKDKGCLACHVTDIASKDTYEEGIGCENCHGPGSEHIKHVRKDKEKGALKKIDGYKFCEDCHNKKSPTFQGFDTKKDWDKIKHATKKG